MTKSSIPVTDKQDEEADTAGTEALRELIRRRLNEPMIPTIEMGSRVEAMIERKRRSL